MAKKRQRGNGQGSLFKRQGRGPWLATWFDHNGKRHEKSTRTTDKAAAERILAKYVTDTALRREGVVDPHLDAISDESRRTIESHLTDYEAKLKTANRTTQHIETTIGYIRAISSAADWATVADIDADAVNRYAGTLREAGWSARTVQAYLTAIKGFAKWMARHQKLLRDPLASVTTPNPKSNRRRERRILLHEEWDWVRATTTDGPARLGMTDNERVLLYVVAIQTGLRSSELRSLTRGSLYLDADRPYITCKAGSTKNAKDARQYIQPDLADALREHIATKAPGAAVFSLPNKDQVADMLRADLFDARQGWLKAAKHDPDEYERRTQSDFLADVNHEGEHLDFHSLRHTCGAWLAMTGAHPKEVQSVMRHSSITLTMDTYGHLFPGREADAVARLPGMMEPHAKQATGTLGVADSAQQYTQQWQRETTHTHANQCNETSHRSQPHDDHKPFQGAKIGKPVRSNAMPDTNWPGRVRTCNLLIQSQAFCQLNYGPMLLRPSMLVSPQYASTRFLVSGSPTANAASA